MSTYLDGTTNSNAMNNSQLHITISKLIHIHLVFIQNRLFTTNPTYYDGMYIFQPFFLAFLKLLL